MTQNALERWAFVLHVGAGVGITLTCLHVLAMIQARSRALIPLVTFTAASAAFCLLGASVRNTADPALHLALFKWWVAAGMISAVPWPWVVRSFAGTGTRTIPSLISLVWIAQVVAQLSLRYGLTLAAPGRIVLAELPLLGIAEYQLEAPAPWWGPCLAAPPLLLWAHLAQSARALRRAGRGRESAFLIAGAVPQAVATLVDAISATTPYRIPYFSDVGFLVFGFALTAMVATQLADAARMKVAVERSEARLRATLNAMEDAVLTLDPQSRVLQVNPAAARLLHAPTAELEGSLLSEHVNLSVLDADSQAAASSRELIRRDGTKARVVCTSSTMNAGGEHTGSVVVLRDVTEQEALRVRVKRKENMEVLGQLAGGVAHDFNNALTGIMGAASLLQSTQSEGATQRYAELIVTTAERAAQLSSRLLSFSRRGRLGRAPMSLSDIVVEVTELLRRTVDPRIEVHVERCHEADTVAIEPGEIHSALLNLGLNARDAMLGGGRILYRVYREQVTTASTNRYGLRRAPGWYVCVDVQDEGTGMTEETVEHVFEPFFTTKELGRGSGLGLAAVWGAMAHVDGGVDVRTELGKGSTFTLYFPAAEAAPPRPRAHAGNWPLRPGIRVLVADDDVAVRTVCGDTLRQAGFEVTTVADGATALSVLEEDPSLALAVVDVRMPKLSGLELFTRMGERVHRPPFIMMSGFVGTDEGSDGLPRQEVDVLRKPFTPDALLGAVRSRLGAESDGHPRASA